jgi:hypothetical protein
MSHALASPQPPANALPRTAETIGTGACRINKNNSISERASAWFSATEACEIFRKAERSAPEQKSLPAPLIRITLVDSVLAAVTIEVLRASMSSSLRAFRFSGRLSVILPTLPSFVYKTVLVLSDIPPLLVGDRSIQDFLG